MMHFFPLLTAASLAFLPVLPAAAQESTPMDHSGHAMTGMETPATLALMQANASMHAAMDIPYTGNPDVDFVTAMIPHHQGAVEMARIELEYGTDPDIRKLAQGVIAAQEAEIAFMQEWLAKQGQ